MHVHVYQNDFIVSKFAKIIIIIVLYPEAASLGADWKVFRNLVEQGRNPLLFILIRYYITLYCVKNALNTVNMHLRNMNNLH